jgi:hypothetical protein
MRLIVATIVVGTAVALGCATGTAASRPLGSAALAQLTITVWPEGQEAGIARRWTLRCQPVGGTHPARVRACTRLTTVYAPFRPVPSDAFCTAVYGGPQEALVTGTFRGRRVNARFSRTDGCQIARWNRVGVLFPVGVGA